MQQVAGDEPVELEEEPCPLHGPNAVAAELGDPRVALEVPFSAVRDQLPRTPSDGLRDATLHEFSNHDVCSFGSIARKSRRAQLLALSVMAAFLSLLPPR